MKRGILWALMSFLIVLVMIITSCGQVAPTATTTTATTIPGTTNQTQTVTPSTSVTPTTTPMTSAVEVPKYGGTLNIISAADTKGFDDSFGANRGFGQENTNEELWDGDWTKGLAGTGEVTWFLTGFEAYLYKYAKGCLAESWEITGTNNDSLVLHIRKGVRWQNKPPTNGRELVADDVAFTIKRQYASPTSFLSTSYPPGPQSVTTPDKYTVVLKYASLSQLGFAERQVCDLMKIWPRDAVEAHNNDMRDWRYSIGTGPFILTDYVQAASMTLGRNPNYWDQDPIGPGKGNQLPYIDTLKFLIIPDVSTQSAAIRTGKADQCIFSWDMATSLLKSNPDLKSAKAMTVWFYQIMMRVDNPEFPWSNLKVRQALFMSVDREAIVNSYYGGNAVVYSFPASATIESKDFFVPMNQLPQNVQDLWKFQPDKAKQMLVDAGYGKGFDMELVCLTTDVDLLSIYKSYWAKIGVNLILDPKEFAVFNSIVNSRSQKQGIFKQGNMNVPFDFMDFIGTGRHNACYLNDARINQAVEQTYLNFLDWNKRCQIYKDITPYVLENCWVNPAPAFYQYTLWQPWLKNYHGEISVGNNNQWSWAKYVWVDQDLKAKTQK